MRLADFILANVEPILEQWEDFARSIWPGAATDPATLRDHAEAMLLATASDMKSDQTAMQQADKSKGKGGHDVNSTGVDRASVAHGVGRVDSGFDLAALIAEYRALRASVIHLWRESRPNPDLHDLDDLTRFHESIDQSLGAAILAYTGRLEGERQAAVDKQNVHAREVREMNDVLLTSSVKQHELTEKAEQARAEANESEERYRTLFDMGPVAIYSTNASGVIQTFNRRAAALWGRAPAPGDTDERFCGSFKMFRPDGTFMPHEQCPMADVLSGAVPFVQDGEVHIERPDGSRVIVTVTIRPLKNQLGEITGAVNYFYDITDRKQAEELLLQAKQAAEDANRAKDTFLAVLSHELRTPLTPVLMAAVAMEFNPDLPLALRDDVKMIRRNVELESKLIDDLLDLSRITNGKLRLTFDLVGINDLLRQACDTCRPQIQEKGIHLHCEVIENAGDVVGDPARLQQVFWNLLNNAAKFTPEGGHIYVNAEHIGDSTEEAQVRVTVRDTGRGIAPEILPHIFNAFEQGEARITRQFGGMGLGLAICKVLVEQHKGSIRAETEGPGKGSTFIVELPALSRKQSATSAQPKSSPRAIGGIEPLRLLIVEDHADTVRVLSRLLRTLGHTVTTATTGTAALALAATHTFDIVISDLGLPDMTGHDLMKQLKGEHGIRGIAISGYGMEEDTRKSAQAGFSDHLVKPVNFVQLEASIGRVAGNGDSM